MAGAKGIVLDTCALIWWTLKPQMLSENALNVIAQNEGRERGILVCSISIWEIGIKCKYKKLDIGGSIEEYVRLLKSLPSVDIIAVDEDLWIDSLAFDWSHKDPADRVIVALAKKKDATLLTSDRIIHNFYSNCVW